MIRHVRLTAHRSQARGELPDVHRVRHRQDNRDLEGPAAARTDRTEIGRAGIGWAPAQGARGPDPDPRGGGGAGAVVDHAGDELFPVYRRVFYPAAPQLQGVEVDIAG